MEAKVYLLGDIGFNAELQPNGISDIAFISQCEKSIRAGATSLRVEIDSNGGLVDAGNNIASYIKTCSVPVTTVAVGKAYSISSKIFFSAPYRKMRPNAKIMIHNNWADGIKGDADQVAAIAEQMAETEKQMRKDYVQATGLSEDVIDGLMKSETYIGAEEAMALGICNEIEEESLVLAKSKSDKMSKKPFSKSLIEWAQAIVAGKEKAMVVKLNNGTDVFVESEDENFTGKRVFLMEDGAPSETPAPDGEHTLESGKVIVVSGGVITEVKDSEMAGIDKEKEEMKAKIAELESALAEKDKALLEVKGEVASVKEIAESAKNELVQLAKSIKSEYKAPDATPQFGRKIEHKEEKGSFDKQAMKERRANYKK